MQASPEFGRRAIIITGPVGVGKTTVMAALTELLEKQQHANAGIDMDHLRWFYPKAPDDVFGGEIGRKHLAFMAANYRAMGIQTIVVADVIEHEVSRRELQQALADYPMHVVRLKVPMNLIRQRLAARETAEHLQWYLNRAPELEQIMDNANVGDTIIEVGERPPHDIAAEIIRRLGLA